MRYFKQVLIAMHLAIATVSPMQVSGAEQKPAAISHLSLDDAVKSPEGYSRVTCEMQYEGHKALFSCDRLAQYWHDNVPRNGKGAIDSSVARNLAASYVTQKKFVDAFILYDLLGDRKLMQRTALATFANPGTVYEDWNKLSSWEEQTVAFLLQRAGARPGKNEYTARGDRFLDMRSPEQALASYTKANAKSRIRDLARQNEHSNPALAVRAYGAIADHSGLERMTAQVGRVEVERLQAGGEKQYK